MKWYVHLLFTGYFYEFCVPSQEVAEKWLESYHDFKRTGAPRHCKGGQTVVDWTTVNGLAIGAYKTDYRERAIVATEKIAGAVEKSVTSGEEWKQSEE